VNLTENPIFLTQKRLTHRAGVLAAILIAALIGLSLLSGLIAYLADPRDFNFQSPQFAGKVFLRLGHRCGNPGAGHRRVQQNLEGAGR